MTGIEAGRNLDSAGLVKVDQTRQDRHSGVRRRAQHRARHYSDDSARGTIKSAIPGTLAEKPMALDASVTDVSAADTTYFDLLRELVISLRQGPLSRVLAVSTLDLRPGAEHKPWLQRPGSGVL